MRPKPKRMTASKMDKRITYKGYTQTQGDYNEPINTPVDFATVWASIEPIKGIEHFKSDQVNSEISHRIRHLYISGITPDMEIAFGTRIFELVGPPINIDERNFEMEVMCKERVNP